MGGIAGVWHLDGQPVDADLVRKMCRRLQHRAPDGFRHWTEGPVALISAQSRFTPEAANDRQPVTSDSGALVVFDGRLDDREILLRRIPLADPTTPDPALVAAAYDRYGNRVAEVLAGDFAFAIYDPSDQVLLLGRDAMGMRPLFVLRTPRIVAFASEIKALLAHPGVVARPNEDELAYFVLTGAPQGRGNHTFFSGIERVLPANVMKLRSDGTGATRQYWDFDFHRRIRLRSFEEYAEGFRHYFRQAVARRLRSTFPVAVSLSGGLDSTSVFGVAHNLHRTEPNRYAPVVAITFSPPDGTVADEWAFLVAIEDFYDVEVLSVLPKTVQPTQVAWDVVWAAEVPGVETFWDCTRSVLNAVTAAGARVLLSGHLGDQLLFDRAYLVDLFDRLRWATIVRHIREWPRWNLEGDTSPLQREFVRRVVRDHVPKTLLPLARRLRAKVERPLWDRPWYTDRFRRLGSRPVTAHPIVRWQFATAHTHSIYWQVRGPSGVASLEALDHAWSRHGVECALPYADRDLVGYLMAIPGEMASHHGVPRALLREAVRGTIPESVRMRRWKGSFGPMIDAAVDADRANLVRAAKQFSTSIRLGFVDGDKLARALTDLRADPSNEWVLAGLNQTLALETWCDRFFGGDRRAASAPSAS